MNIIRAIGLAVTGTLALSATIGIVKNKKEKEKKEKSK